MSEFRKVHYGALSAKESLENEAILALETRFGSRAPLILRFMKTMSEHGMPGAQKLYTEPPEIKAPGFIGKFLLGRAPEITGGSPVNGYVVGALTATKSGGDYVGIVYLCDDLELRVHEGAAGGHGADSTEPVTNLGENWFYIGQLYEHKEKSPTSSIYYQHDGPKFRRMPLAEVLNTITAAQINTD